MSVIKGDCSPSIVYPKLLPEPLYLCFAVLVTTLTVNVLVTPTWGAKILSIPPNDPLRSNLWMGSVVPIPTELL